VPLIESEENRFPYFERVSCHFAKIARRISWESEDIVIYA